MEIEDTGSGGTVGSRAGGSGRRPDGAVRTEDGSWTLRGGRDGDGETCHSLSGARTEARRHAEILFAPFASGSASAPAHLRILDVGFGLGLNAAAAIERAATHLGGTPTMVVGLEHDRDLLARGLELPRDPDPGFDAHLGRLRAALTAALDGCEARERGPRNGGPRARGPADDGPLVLDAGPGARVELWLGDARRTLERAAPAGSLHGILLDPFSPGSDGRLWEPGFLERLATRLAPSGRIATYSAATRVRAGLAAAGLAVGPTPRLGSKAEGTVASRGGPVPPFDPRTARRVARRAAALVAERTAGG